MFDPINYFKALTQSLKLTKDKYHFTKVSGLDKLEGILSARKEYSHFIAVDDTENGAFLRGGGGGFFDRRPSTIFICAALDIKDPSKRESLLNEFRSIHKSFVSKLIRDKNDNGLVLMDFSRIPYYEMPSYFANGCIGIYFMIHRDEPTNLTYNESEWE